jgi:flagellar basal-body rod modification protein FlgD
MGEGDSTADDVAVLIDQTLLDPSVITLKDNKITIDGSVFENAPNGTYKVTVIFNDILLTSEKDMVTVTVKNSTAVPMDPEEPEEPNEPADPEEPEEPNEPADSEEPE